MIIFRIIYYKLLTIEYELIMRIINYPNSVKQFQKHCSSNKKDDHD